ncbi:MAG: biosynthetic-type acetolactate synthase large subunit [Peptococcaceae bacterium]|jgi:acetolactate synthase-1/2/3 large subunit|nr:biosynthetic-type acetolactate synthase large subunit [Peptococcaceae bacterium]
MKNGAQYIIDFLLKKNVEVVFGYPGGQILNFYEFLGRSALRHILARHEQGAAHAACGYARATGRPGVCVATSGPGATNLVTGIADACLDSIPLLAITGQVHLRDIGKDSFQEADITGIVTPVTKHSYLLENLEQLPSVLDEAWQVATTGRPGPVLIDVPKNFFLEEQEMRLTHQPLLTRKTKKPDQTEEMLPLIIAKIRKARQPLILAGGGLIAADACRQLAELVALTGIPVVNTLMGKGAYPEEQPQALGLVGMHGLAPANLALNDCDLLLCLGTRFSDRVTGNRRNFANQACIIHVDIDGAELRKNVDVQYTLQMDAAAFLDRLLREKDWRKNRGITTWQKRIRQWRQDYDLPRRFTGPLKPQEVIQEAARQAGSEVIVVADVGQHQMFTAQYYPVSRGRCFLTSGGLGAMGFGLPAAMGAAFGRPGETVLLFVGDGGFQMTSQELAVIREFNLPVKVLIINNGKLGMIRQWQDVIFERHFVASDLPDCPDFVKLAAAYDLPARRVTVREELADAVAFALAVEGPALVDFRVDPEELVLPFILPGGTPAEMLGRWRGETHLRGFSGK